MMQEKILFFTLYSRVRVRGFWLFTDYIYEFQVVPKIIEKLNQKSSIFVIETV